MIDLDDWLQVDEHHDAELARKRAILREHHDTAFRVLDGVETESDEILDAVVDHMRPTPTWSTGGGRPTVG